MTTTLDASTTRPPILAVNADLQLLRAGARLWRVIDARGRVIGHLEALGGDPTARYRARRFHAASRAFRDLGEFWSAEDAVESLRYAR